MRLIACDLTTVSGMKPCALVAALFVDGAFLLVAVVVCLHAHASAPSTGGHLQDAGVPHGHTSLVAGLDAVVAAPFGMRFDAIESFQGSNVRAETLPSSHEKPSHLLRRRIARLWLQKL